MGKHARMRLLHMSGAALQDLTTDLVHRVLTFSSAVEASHPVICHLSPAGALEADNAALMHRLPAM
jgi:hypothetical protein